MRLPNAPNILKEQYELLYSLPYTNYTPGIGKIVPRNVK